jgi:hypothetical protein
MKRTKLKSALKRTSTEVSLTATAEKKADA